MVVREKDAAYHAARQRFDSTLLEGALADKDSVRSLVREQLLAKRGRRDSVPDSELPAVQKRVAEAWDFLEAMRSAAGDAGTQPTNDNDVEGREWKVKQDTGRMRVMHRRGPEGTPLHTMCLEGIIHGPMQNALCIAWAAPHFKEWWPQFSVPPFRITDSSWLKRISPGEDIGLVRFKVPWPFAAREIVLLAYAVDFFEEDMLIVIMHTLPEDPTEVHELYEKGDVPPVENGVVRMGVAGGYIFQRISPDECYFRTIADIDMKLDIVPAWVINFIARQLAGHGLKLFESVIHDVTVGKKTKFVDTFRELVSKEPLIQHVVEGMDAFGTIGKPPCSKRRPSTNGVVWYDAPNDAPGQLGIGAFESADRTSDGGGVSGQRHGSRSQEQASDDDEPVEWFDALDESAAQVHLDGAGAGASQNVGTAGQGHDRIGGGLSGEEAGLEGSVGAKERGEKGKGEDGSGQGKLPKKKLMSRLKRKASKVWQKIRSSKKT